MPFQTEILKQHHNKGLPPQNLCSALWSQNRCDGTPHNIGTCDFHLWIYKYNSKRFINLWVLLYYVVINPTCIAVTKICFAPSYITSLPWINGDIITNVQQLDHSPPPSWSATMAYIVVIPGSSFIPRVLQHIPLLHRISSAALSTAPLAAWILRLPLLHQPSMYILYLPYTIPASHHFIPPHSTLPSTIPVK